MTKLPKNRPPTHPGEMLREEFLVPLGITQTELAERIGVSFPRINEIINGKRGVTPDSALRLAQLFRTTPEFWLDGQRNWDLWQALHSPRAKEIRRIKPVGPPALSHDPLAEWVDHEKVRRELGLD